MEHASGTRRCVGRSAVVCHAGRRRRSCMAIAVTAVALTGCVGEGNTDRADGREVASSLVVVSSTTTTLLSTTTSTRRADPAPSAGPTSEAAEGFDLDAIVTGVLDDADGGVAALVVRDGEVLTAAAGERNAGGDPMTAETPSRVGSISKTFVGTMVLQLVDEGRVNLDQRLATYLPETSAGADVTIRDLLRHHSGVPSYTDVSAFFPDVLADRSRRFVPADLLTYIEDVAPQPAGQRFTYSNTNYILLGQLIERLDGVDLNTALQTRISVPLGLPMTRFVLDDGASVPGLAAGWSADVVEGGPVSPYDSIASSAWAAGALVSTTTELAAFLTALFAGDLISDESLAAMTDGGPYGYGLGLFEERFGPDPARHGYGHHGGMPGYLSFMVIEPTGGDIVVVLTNNDRVDIGAVLRQISDDW